MQAKSYKEFSAKKISENLSISENVPTLVKFISATYNVSALDPNFKGVLILCYYGKGMHFEDISRYG